MVEPLSFRHLALVPPPRNAPQQQAIAEAILIDRKIIRFALQFFTRAAGIVVTSILIKHLARALSYDSLSTYADFTMRCTLCASAFVGMTLRFISDPPNA